MAGTPDVLKNISGVKSHSSELHYNQHPRQALYYLGGTHVA